MLFFETQCTSVVAIDCEMKKLIGLLFVMGVVKKPSLAKYWTTNPLFHMPLFRLTVPRNRFILLLKFFHVNNNRNIPNCADPNRDKLDELFEKFQVAYTLRPSLAVDESLLLWKGRLIFKQYLPLKRAWFGSEMFCLCATILAIRIVFICIRADKILPLLLTLHCQPVFS